MKRTATIFLCGLVATASASHAQEAKPQKPVTPTKLTVANTDDALVEFGRAAKMNFMADATQFSQQETPLANDTTHTVEEHLAELVAKQHLALLPQEQMFLLWNAPDLPQFARLLAQGDTIKLYALPPVETSKPTLPLNGATRPTAKALETKTPSFQEAVFQELSDYLSATAGWDGQTPGSVAEVRISDLPPALHDKVAAAVQREILRPASVAVWNAWFDDRFWQNAQLRVVQDSNGKLNGPKISVLTVGGSIRIGSGSGGSMISLGALKDKAK